MRHTLTPLKSPAKLLPDDARCNEANAPRPAKEISTMMSPCYNHMFHLSTRWTQCTPKDLHSNPILNNNNTSIKTGLHVHLHHQRPLVLELLFTIYSAFSYGPFSASHASHSSLNSFISHGLMAPNCCPPGNDMTLNDLNANGPMPSS